MTSAAKGSEWPGVLLALAAYAVFYFAMLYQPGLVRMDDFGYLRSVGETIAAGRPQTDDWLEPYSATISTAGALAYALTGDFPLATWGLHSLWALLAFWLIRKCLRARMDAGPATLLAFALAGLPMYAHKASEFSGNVPTLACVLLAFLAYRARRWGWFYTAAFFAFANRQNALALLVLPAWEAWSSLRKKEFGDHRRILFGGMAFAIAATALHFSLNRTAAQALGIYAGFTPDRLVVIARGMLFGLCAGLALLSCFSLLTGDRASANLRANRARPWAPAAASIAFALAVWVTPLPLFSFLTPLLGSLDRGFGLQFAAMACIPILFWILDWRQIRLDGPMFLALGFVLVSGLKGYWYDFYLMEVAVGAILFRLTRPQVSAPGRFARVVAYAVIAGNLVWACGYKVFTDKQRFSVHLYERLERSGRVSPAEMTDATFGFLGWKLAEAFRDLKTQEDLAQFQGFVRRDQVVIDTETPWRRAFKRGAEGAKILEVGTVNIAWFPLRYRVMDLRGNPPVSLLNRLPLPFDAERYPREPFPLSGEEWGQWVDAQCARNGEIRPWFRLKGPGP